MSRTPVGEWPPRWVDDAARELTRAGEELEAVRLRIAALALELRAHDVATDEVTSAHHDIAHADGHITRTRRALLMTWPELVDATPSRRRRVPVPATAASVLVLGVGGHALRLMRAARRRLHALGRLLIPR